MPAPVFSLSTSGTDPKLTTKQILEDEVNRVVEILFDQANPEDRDAAELSATNALSSKNAAAASSLAAANSAADALNAALASGPVVPYATKAAANAALAGLAADTVVEVSIDESRSGRRTRYRKTGGAYVFEIYVDTRAAIPILDQLRYRMSVGRVDFVGIGDSNQIFGGHGWDHGFQYALTTLGYPMWATGLLVNNEANGTGAGAGYSYNRNGPGGSGLTGVVTGAPADLEKYMDKGAGLISPSFYYSYVAAASSISAINNGLVLLPGLGGLDETAAIDFDHWWGSFNSGSGSFTRYLRRGEAPFTEIVNPPSINTNTGVFAMNRSTVSMSASGTRAGWRIQFLAGNAATGPYFGTFLRARQLNRTTGFSYGTLNYRGGQSTRTVAYDLQQASDETLTHYFSILRADQVGGANGLKTICIVVNEGMNDRNETLTSVGPGAVADGDSPEAFVDNHKAIVNRINAIWDLNAWPKNELYFLFVPSHPIDDPDDAELLSYRDALEAYSFSLSRAQFVNIPRLTNEAEMLANNWYQSSGADRLHLTQPGYEQLALRIWGATA